MKKIVNYLKNREESLFLLLRKPSSKYTPETFHKLRLEIKKINAFFDLVQFCSNDFKRKKAFQPFKLIFRQAGKVRELQLEETMFKKYLRYNSLNTFFSNLTTMRQKEETLFFLMVNKDYLNQIQKNLDSLHPYLSDIDNKKTVHYLKKKRKKIKKIISQGTLEKKELHQLRKYLKILNHNKTIYKKESPDKSLQKKEDLSELLGNWHDLQVIVNHLKKTLNNNPLRLEEINHLKDIKTKITLQREIVLNKINNNLARFKYSFS